MSSTILVSNQVTKKVAKRLLKQESNNKPETIKEFYKEIRKELENKRLIDNFIKTSDPSIMEAIEENNFHSKEILELEPTYGTQFEELEKRAKKLNPSYGTSFEELENRRKKLLNTPLKKNQNKRKNFAEDNFQEATNNVKEAHSIILKRLKQDLKDLKKYQRDSQHTNKNIEEI